MVNSKFEKNYLLIFLTAIDKIPLLWYNAQLKIKTRKAPTKLQELILKKKKGIKK